jgi:MFS family permease
MTAPHDNVVAVLARLPVRARALLAADAVNAFGAGLVLPFLLIYLSQVRHLDVRVAAAALSVSALFGFVAGLGWGALLDRYSHRAITTTVMLMAGAGTCLYAVTDAPWSALAVSALYGVGFGGVGPVLRTVFATVVPAPERTLFFGIQFGIFNAFIGLGILAGGLLNNGTVGRYQVLYLGDGITFGVMAVALLIFLPGRAGSAAADEPGSEGDAGAAGRPRPSYRSVLRSPALILILVTMTMAATFYYGQFQSTLPGYLTIRHAVSARGISGAFVVNVVVIVLAQFVVMPRLRQIRRTTWVTASGLLWAAAWLLVLWAGQTSGAAALVLLFAASVPFAAAEVMVTPVLVALLNDIVGDDVRGRANALFTFALTGGSILGPAITAALLPVGRGVPLVAALAAGCLLMLIPAARLRGRLASDVDKPPVDSAPAAAGAVPAGSEERSRSAPT